MREIKDKLFACYRFRNEWVSLLNGFKNPEGMKFEMQMPLSTERKAYLFTSKLFQINTSHRQNRLLSHGVLIFLLTTGFACRLSSSAGIQFSFFRQKNQLSDVE